MRLLEVEKIARSKGIKDTWKYSKKQLVRRIQSREGNIQCFAGPARIGCKQLNCCWRSDCGVR